MDYELQGIGTPSSVRVTRPNGRGKTLPIVDVRSHDAETFVLMAMEDNYAFDPHAEVWPLTITKG